MIFFPSFLLLQQNYSLDFTHFNIEELDLTDQRFFWNRNVVNWRRTIFCYELYVFLSVVRSYVISRLLGEKKLVMLLPTQMVFTNLPRNNIKRLKGTFGFIWRVLKTIWWIVLQLFWSGGVHKLRWQVFTFFDHLPPYVDIFYLINVDKKLTFLDCLPSTKVFLST